jgi:hypothetical protein
MNALKDTLFRVSILLCFIPIGCKSPITKVNLPRDYQGKPYRDSAFAAAPQKIPGKVYCAYYDLGGEGVAYHDTTPKNLGSGGLNPANGTYLNDFRMNEAVDTSYVKFHDDIDNNPYDLVQPPDKMLYVGWTEPGEWFNLTVDVQHAGNYSLDLLYTSHQGGSISFDLNGNRISDPLPITSTFNAADPLAWRQWHHWNVMKDLAKLYLPNGIRVLTVRILAEGNMNLGYIEFRRI